MGFLDAQANVAHLNSFDSPEISMSELDRNWKRLNYEAVLPPGMPILFLKAIMPSKTVNGEIVPNVPNLTSKINVEMKPATPLAVSLSPEAWKFHSE